MARLRVLERIDVDTYEIVVHSPVPAATNDAGRAWADVVKAALKPATRMAIGVLPGAISQAEADAIAAGQVLETKFNWVDNPALTPAQRLADLTARAAAIIAETQANLAVRLRWYGLEVT